MSLAAELVSGRDDGLAIDDGREALSTRELLDRVRAAARCLADGSTRSLGLLASNGASWIVLDLAARESELRVVPMPEFFTDEQLGHLLESAAVDTVATDDAARVERICPDAAEVGTTAGLTLLRLAERPPVQGRTRAETVTFTSGTTGAPKGARLAAPTLTTVARSLAAATSMGPGDRHLCLLPLSILLETVGGVYRSLCSGATVLAPELTLEELGLAGSCEMDAERCASALEWLRPTSTILMPQQLASLVEHHERRGTRAPGELRFVGVGGAPVPRGLLERARAVGIPAYEGYGLTEAGSVVALNVPSAHRSGTVGRPLPHVEVRLSESGELLVRGALADGYLDAPLVEQGDGWLATGDLASIDDGGFVTLRGRIRNEIITAFGRNVSPEWVERELEGQPGIRRAAVLGEGLPALVAVIEAEPDRRNVSRPGTSVEDAILAANEQLPDYARVAAWTLAETPLDAASGLATPNGRLKRETIAARYTNVLEPLLEERHAPKTEPETTPWASSES